MSTADPRVLVQALEDLDEELGRWSSQARNALGTAWYEYELGREQANRLTHRAAITSYQAEEDRQTVDAADAELARLTDRCKAVHALAESSLSDASKNLARARETQERWNNELSRALAWLDRARRRLTNALAEQTRAYNVLREAEATLSWAQSRLNSCRNDRNRRNCWGEEADVNRAISNVRAAQASYEQACIEVAEAEEEVAMAEARVACCSNAVGNAEAAVGLAHQAVEAGDLAVASAERSLELARAAEGWLIEARQHLDEQTEAAEEAVTSAFRASIAADDAYNDLLSADRAGDSAQQACSDVRRELDARTDQLRQFNAPTLDDFVGRA